MITVKRKIRAGNEKIELAKCLAGKAGWSLSEKKKGIMSVTVFCTYEVQFKDEKDYEQNLEIANEKFEQDLLSAGFSKAYIEKNSGKFALPKEKIEVVVKTPMTWKEWHNSRHKK